MRKPARRKMLTFKQYLDRKKQLGLSDTAIARSATTLHHADRKPTNSAIHLDAAKLIEASKH